MAMRMVTIFVALIVCGMFFPDPARGDDYLSSDQGLDVDFSDVVVGEEKIIPLVITNQSESVFTLILLLNMDAACNFTYTGPNIVNEFKPGDSLNVQVMFTPSDVGVCNAVLQIQYFGSGGLVEINFTANGIEEVSQTFEEIVIGGFRTGVDDRMDGENNSIKDMIGECEATAYNPGQLRRCVKRLTRALMREGTINYQEMRVLHRAAIRAEIQKMVKEIKASRGLKTSKRSGRSKWWCWWRR